MPKAAIFEGFISTFPEFERVAHLFKFRQYFARIALLYYAKDFCH
jgi:hypothetical protein